MSSNPLPPSPSQQYLEDNIAPQMLAIIGTSVAIVSVCVIMRIYVRACVLKKFGIDDWLIVLASILSLTCFSLFTSLTRNGIGRHVEFYTHTRPDLFSVFFKIIWWYAWIIVLAYTAIKLSIACFLLRLTGHSLYWSWFLRSLIVILILFSLGSVLSLILQCLPVKAFWELHLRRPKGNAICMSDTMFRKIGLFNSVFNLFTDLVLAIIPVPMVWKLQMRQRTKISLCIILGLGLFACATAVYKIPIQWHYFEEKDFSYKGAWYFVWQQIEMNVGITAACLPTLKPLAADFFGAVKALTSGPQSDAQMDSRHILSRRSQPPKGISTPLENNGSKSYSLQNMVDSQSSKDERAFLYQQQYTERMISCVPASRHESKIAKTTRGTSQKIKGITKTIEVQVV